MSDRTVDVHEVRESRTLLHHAGDDRQSGVGHYSICSYVRVPASGVCPVCGDMTAQVVDVGEVRERKDGDDE